MSAAMRCDACGTLTSDSVESSRVVFYAYNEAFGVSMSKVYHNLDLCPECVKKIEEVLGIPGVTEE